jgi:hypothetical protein
MQLVLTESILGAYNVAFPTNDSHAPLTTSGAAGFCQSADYYISLQLPASIARFNCPLQLPASIARFNCPFQLLALQPHATFYSRRDF